MIGLKRGTVKLVKHNPEWRQSFAKEEKEIRRVLGQDCIDIQHVGSTAIPGILAKPIIDIAVVVPALEKVKRSQVELKAIGYELKENDARIERLFFTKGSEEKRTHYLHVGEIGSGYTEDMILFRDYLCNHKDAAEEYSELKRSLAEKYQNMREMYTRKKQNFIESILAKAKK